MKRFSLIFLSALVVIAASCSKNDPKHPQKDAWVDDLSLPVPIEFGSSNFHVETKAGIVDADNIGDTRFYVWAADTAKTVSWAEDADEEILLRNIPARISSPEEGTDKSTVQFKTADDKNITYFYPYGSKFNYSFFAYGVQASEVPQCKYDSEEDAYYAEFDLGFDDIVYAESHAHIKSGFNAQYIRTYYAQEDRMPHLQFQHLTSALHFNFKIDEDAVSEISNVEMVKIDSIVIKNVPTKAKLWVAHKDKATSGTLVRDDESRDNLRIELDTRVDEDGIADLGYVFLAPQKATDDDCGIIKATMYVKVPLMQVEGEEIIYEKFSVDLEIKRTKKDGVRNTFAAGSVYTVTITMMSPREVVVTAGIQSWLDGYLDDSISGTTGTVIR